MMPSEPRLPRSGPRKFLDTLAMNGVRHGLAFADNALEHAALGDLDRMLGAVAHVGIVGFWARWSSALTFLRLGFEAAAQNHIQFLKAAANAEQRNARSTTARISFRVMASRA